MVRKTVIFISIAALLNLSPGCTSSSLTTVPGQDISSLAPDSVSTYPDRKILKSYLRGGGVLVYNEDGGRYRNTYQGRDSVMLGVLSDGALVVTPIREIDSVCVQETVPKHADPLPSGPWAWVALAAGVGIIVGLALVMGNNFGDMSGLGE